MTDIAEPATGRALWPTTTVATAAMATSMIALYAISGLGPALVTDLGLSRTEVGGLVAATFAVAAVTSSVSGAVADAVGARRALLVLFGVVSVALVGASQAGSYGWLLVTLALAGVGQALANPATNLLIAGTVAPHRRGLAIGLKQSGVQLAAVAGGVLLPILAGALGWRAALAWTVLVPALCVAVVLMIFPADEPRAGPRPWWRWSKPSRWQWRLMGYSMLLGTGLAAVNTYLPLYANQQLHFGARSAGWVLAAFGLSGLVARVWWTRWADRLPDVTAVLVWLSAGAGLAVVAVWAAQANSGLVWLGAIGVGATATGANAVSMLAVVRQGGATGHASALVSLGFFSGFVVGPATFGMLADRGGYPLAWCVVAMIFAGSAVAAIAVAGAPESGAVTR